MIRKETISVTKTVRKEKADKYDQECFCGGILRLGFILDKGRFLPANAYASQTSDEGKHVFLIGVVMRCDDCHTYLPVQTFKRQ